MSRLEETLEKILENYIESLDNGKENLELLMKLKEASKKSIEARNYYKEARLNQYFYYRRLAVAHKANVVDGFFFALKEREKQNEHVNIWTYFNKLKENKNLSWGEILRTAKLSPRLARDIQKEEMDLKRITPQILAKITSLLEGDPKKVINLAYRFFLERKDIIPMPKGFAVSYREVRDGFVDDSNGGSFEKKDDEQQQIIEYIKELEELFS